MPSQPLLGMPVVVGISAAVMAMRSVSSATAEDGKSSAAVRPKAKLSVGRMARKRRVCIVKGFSYEMLVRDMACLPQQIICPHYRGLRNEFCMQYGALLHIYVTFAPK